MKNKCILEGVVDDVIEEGPSALVLDEQEGPRNRRETSGDREMG